MTLGAILKLYPPFSTIATAIFRKVELTGYALKVWSAQTVSICFSTGCIVSGHAFRENQDKTDRLHEAQIGAAMRKLLCLSLGVLKSGVPFDPSYTVLLPA